MCHRIAFAVASNLEGKFLVGKRKNGQGDHPGGWDFIGTEVRDDESDDKALIREFKTLGNDLEPGRYLGKRETSNGKIALWYDCRIRNWAFKPHLGYEGLQWVSNEIVPVICNDSIDVWPEEVSEYLHKGLAKAKAY